MAAKKTKPPIKNALAGPMQGSGLAPGKMGKFAPKKTKKGKK